MIFYKKQTEQNGVIDHTLVLDQPSVVFIDEIDSLLSARSDTEHESSRRIKTEFLVQLDGCSTVGEERILIVGATNRPQVQSL